MENKAIAGHIKRLGQLMELYEGNSFKTKAYERAAQVIAKHPQALQDMPESERAQISGIGKSTSTLLTELLSNGFIQSLKVLEDKTPADILTMLNTKGIGPKKTAIIWHELGIETLEALQIACENNQLAQAKGFGAKTQADILNIIAFLKDNKGLFRYADLLTAAEPLMTALKAVLPKDTKLELTGAIRRRLPLVRSIDFLIASSDTTLQGYLDKLPMLHKVQHNVEQQRFQALDHQNVPVHIYYTERMHFAERWIQTTGSVTHVQGLKAYTPLGLAQADDEAAIYQAAGLFYIPPELREGTDSLDQARDGQIPTLIHLEDIKGCLHNHSLWSDGAFSVQEMAEYCRDILQLEYFGISDHSRTAAYANGLSIERVQQQWKEIDQLNQQMAPFRIFKGIESDILNNGDLDYPDEILSGFDFVVASIHAPLSMDESKATQRLIKAIENPYTTMLGHPTGRQLLVRRGYPINFKKVIDACAANQVIIEINSNPLRLDLDWTWLSYCLSKGVQISINPDAHHTRHLHYMRYGVDMARKGGLQAENCINCLNLEKIDSLLKQKKR